MVELRKLNAKLRKCLRNKSLPLCVTEWYWSGGFSLVEIDSPRQWVEYLGQLEKEMVEDIAEKDYYIRNNKLVCLNKVEGALVEKEYVMRIEYIEVD